MLNVPRSVYDTMLLQVASLSESFCLEGTLISFLSGVCKGGWPECFIRESALTTSFLPSVCETVLLASVYKTL